VRGSIVEADNKEEARYLVPPASRASATVIALNKFTMEQIDSITVILDYKRAHRGMQHRLVTRVLTVLLNH
jgi:hypothetical protein